MQQSKEDKAETMFKEIMNETFLYLMRNAKLRLNEAQAR